MTAALDGVSCATASTCVAVGHTTDEHGRVRSLAERWNGAAWIVEPTPDLAAASSSALHGVSCSAASACIAVGYVIDATDRLCASRMPSAGTARAG